KRVPFAVITFPFAVVLLNWDGARPIAELCDLGHKITHGTPTHFANLRADGGIEIDRPDFTAFGCRCCRHEYRPCRRLQRRSTQDCRGIPALPRPPHSRGSRRARWRAICAAQQPSIVFWSC